MKFKYYAIFVGDLCFDIIGVGMSVSCPGECVRVRAS